MQAIERAIQVRQHLYRVSSRAQEADFSVWCVALVVAALLEIADAVRELKSKPVDLVLELGPVESCPAVLLAPDGQHNCNLGKGHCGAHCSAQGKWWGQ